MGLRHFYNGCVDDDILLLKFLNLILGDIFSSDWYFKYYIQYFYFQPKSHKYSKNQTFENGLINAACSLMIDVACYII